jgi:hypothetical protein
VSDSIPLIKPKEFTAVGQDGVEHAYILSIIPATASMEIVVQYGKGLLPGDSYKLTEAMAFKMMSYVAVPPKEKGKEPLRLVTQALIDNHTDFKTYMALQRKMAEYNWGFFLSDDLSDFWDRSRVMVKALVTRIITDSFRPLFQPEKPLSENSKPAMD